MKNLYWLIFIFFLTTEIHPQWVQLNMPDTGEVQPGDVKAISIIGSHLFAGTYGWYDTSQFGGVFLSTNSGFTWIAVSNGLTSSQRQVRALVDNEVNLFAGTAGDGVLLSTNSGASWSVVNNGLTNTDVWSLLISGTDLFAGTYGGGVFLTTDNGTSWTAVNSGLTNTYVTSLAHSGMNLFAGTTGGGVYLSTNNGSSWEAIHIGLTNNDVLSLVISGENIIAGTSVDGIFLSSDHGFNWMQCVTPGLSPNVTGFTVAGKNLFACISNAGGVIYSRDNGFSWTEINDGLTMKLVTAVAVSDTFLFAGTWGGSVWRRSLSELITSTESVISKLPLEFKLYQNYPNPFNPTTSIEYRVVSNEYVTLKVYDVLGNEVAVLVNEEKPAGTYEVTWTAEGLSSGVYFYKLQAGSFTETKKLILLR